MLRPLPFVVPVVAGAGHRTRTDAATRALGNRVARPGWCNSGDALSIGGANHPARFAASAPAQLRIETAAGPAPTIHARLVGAGKLQ